jgi:hypothetical protein
MKTFEKVLISATIIIVILKVFRLPFSGPLIVIATQILSIAYMFGGWKMFVDSQSKSKHYFLSTISGLFFSFALTGILFKLQLWPFAQNFSGMGSFLTLGLLLPYFIFKSKNNDLSKVIYFKDMQRRTLIIGGLCFILFIIPISNLVTFYHPNDPEYVRLFMQMNDNPGNQEYEKNFINYRDMRK